MRSTASELRKAVSATLVVAALCVVAWQVVEPEETSGPVLSRGTIILDQGLAGEGREALPGDNTGREEPSSTQAGERSAALASSVLQDPNLAVRLVWENGLPCSGAYGEGFTSQASHQLSFRTDPDGVLQWTRNELRNAESTKFLLLDVMGNDWLAAGRYKPVVVHLPESWPRERHDAGTLVVRERPLLFEGRVIDEAGRGIQGVTVQVQQDQPSVGWNWAYEKGQSEFHVGLFRSLGDGEISCFADIDAHLGARLYLTHPDHLSATSELLVIDQPLHGTLTMRRASRISGRVLMDPIIPVERIQIDVASTKSGQVVGEVGLRSLEYELLKVDPSTTVDVIARLAGGAELARVGPLQLLPGIHLEVPTFDVRGLVRVWRLALSSEGGSHPRGLVLGTRDDSSSPWRMDPQTGELLVTVAMDDAGPLKLVIRAPGHEVTEVLLTPKDVDVAVTLRRLAGGTGLWPNQE